MQGGDLATGNKLDCEGDESLIGGKLDSPKD
jgi:hypothetical protein